MAPLLRARDEALFVLPAVADQRARLLERGGMTETSDPERARRNATERDLLIRDFHEEQALALDLPILRVDGPLDAMIERAEELFAPALCRRPGGGDLARARRIENETLHDQLQRYRGSGEARPEHLDVPVAFACECGRSGCDAVVELALEDFGDDAVVAEHP